MSTRNYDASYLTLKKQAKALYAYNAANSAAVAAGTSVRREQPSQQTLDVVTLRMQGGCICAKDAANIADFTGPGPCCGGFK